MKRADFESKKMFNQSGFVRKLWAKYNYIPKKLSLRLEVM